MAPAAVPEAPAIAAPAPPAADPERRAIEKAIRKFLAAYPLDGGGNLGALARSRNLWREVSSLTLLQLVAFVERRFAIRVRPIDFVPHNFESVSAIARFIVAQRAAAAPGPRSAPAQP